MVQYNSEEEEAVCHLGMRQAGTGEAGETAVQYTGSPWAAEEEKAVHQEGTVELARIPWHQLVGAEEGTGCCSACLGHGQKHLICSIAVLGQRNFRHMVWVAVPVGPAGSQDNCGRDSGSFYAPFEMMCGDGCGIAGGSQSEMPGGCRKMTSMNDDSGRLGLACNLTRTM
jgi:hypothetical protein